MHNWDYDMATWQGGEVVERWKLERMILYGLGGEKIPEALLRKHLPHLNIPPKHHQFLKLILS